MNTEYIIENVKTMLETNLTTELTTIEVELDTSISTPTPAEYGIGEIDPNVLTLYPSVLIWSPLSRKKNDQQGFQVREVWIRILVWIVENDLENLHRFVTRYGDAVSRIFREETNWNVSLHNPVLEDVNNTDLYKRESVGYAQGCLIEGTVDYILS